MKTPIYDFVSDYIAKNGARLHMPGHKGSMFLGAEPRDITEICGADSLFDADGVISESENNASKLFGTKRTVYSCEGSTLSIKAMLYLAAINRENKNERPVFVAARNVHRAFVYASAELDADVVWLTSKENMSLCSCKISAEDLKETLSKLNTKPAAVYITSPDYLGNTADIAALSQIAHSFGVPLLCDNAHGAYLHFLREKCHPMDLGADMCCDSAHKTLPVLTGGGYLHFSKNEIKNFSSDAKTAMAVFGSTSPSYLILQSLDLANRYLENGYRERLSDTVKKVCDVKKLLAENGQKVLSGEPLKITVNTSAFGKSGCEIAESLRKNNAECEFCDRDFVVMMITPENSDRDFEIIKRTFVSHEKTDGKSVTPKTALPVFELPERRLSIRQAVFCESESIPVESSVGRVAASPAVACPPAIPVVISGETINDSAVKIMKYYGIKNVRVVKD